MLVDSHCHLNMSEFSNDLEDVISKAKNNNIGGFLTICTQLKELKELKSISKKHQNIWYSGGVHPNNIKEYIDNKLNIITEYANDKNFVAIGETGLDYYYENPKIEIQKNSFIKHINMARELGLPIIVHTRDADKDTIDILKTEYKKGEFKGVIHCFSASEELAMEALDINFYISVSGIVTFKNAENIRQTIKKVPLDKLLVETDAPYLAPVPKRGKRNEPAFVRYTAEYLSELKNVSIQKLSEQTTKNFLKLFDKVKLL